MRQLVYRVQPLPQSLLPLVWDFGQLQPLAECLFIEQIVRKKVVNLILKFAFINKSLVIFKGAVLKFDMQHGHLSDRGQGYFLNLTGDRGLKTVSDKQQSYF